jgi:hypothetical protein
MKITARLKWYRTSDNVEVMLYKENGANSNRKELFTCKYSEVPRELDRAIIPLGWAKKIFAAYEKIGKDGFEITTKL